MPDRPNILVIVTDDQGYADLGAFPHSVEDVVTPNMDRLAAGGILFSQAYVTAPVCSPSRAGWNTGRYQQRWGGWHWEAGLPPEESTLAEYLKAENYVTGKFGKSDFGVGYHSHTAREYPLNHGFDEFLGFSSHAHDYFLLSEEIERRTPDPAGDSAALGPLLHNQTRKSYEEGYTTEIFTDEAVAFIDRNASEDFFVTVSYNSVHNLIHEVPERFLKKHGVDPLPNYDPSMGTYQDYYRDSIHPNRVPVEDRRKYYLANLECMDENVGRLLDTLDRLNIAENTLVILFGDNGGAQNTGSRNLPLKGTKHTLYEGGIRVPYVLRWPSRFGGGQTFPHLVSTLDILPTCLDAINVSPDLEPDGRSLLKVISTSTPLHEEPLFWAWGDQYAVRDGDWKLVKGELFRQDLRTRDPQEVALFNIREDIGEENDLSGTETETFGRLQSLFENWRAEMEAQN